MFIYVCMYVCGTCVRGHAGTFVCVCACCECMCICVYMCVAHGFVGMQVHLCARVCVCVYVYFVGQRLTSGIVLDFFPFY